MEVRLVVDSSGGETCSGLSGGETCSGLEWR